jgi:hypothetical protein
MLPIFLLFGTSSIFMIRSLYIIITLLFIYLSAGDDNFNGWRWWLRLVLILSLIFFLSINISIRYISWLLLLLIIKISTSTKALPWRLFNNAVIRDPISVCDYKTAPADSGYISAMMCFLFLFSQTFGLWVFCARINSSDNLWGLLWETTLSWRVLNCYSCCP